MISAMGLYLDFILPCFLCFIPSLTPWMSSTVTLKWYVPNTNLEFSSNQTARNVNLNAKLFIMAKKKPQSSSPPWNQSFHLHHSFQGGEEGWECAWGRWSGKGKKEGNSYLRRTYHLLGAVPNILHFPIYINFHFISIPEWPCKYKYDLIL